MAYNPLLQARIANLLDRQAVIYLEKKMFGGLFFMVDNKMCVGLLNGGLMARVGPDAMEEVCKSKGVRQLLHGTRPMKGFAFIEPEAIEEDEELDFYLLKCLEYNPIAKASKKKKKKKNDQKK